VKSYNPDAVLLFTNADQSYSNMLITVRQFVTPKHTKNIIEKEMSIRRTNIHYNNYEKS